MTTNCTSLKLGRFLPVDHVRLGDNGVTYSEDAGQWTQGNAVLSLCARLDGDLLHLTGFRATPNGLHKFWQLTHRGAFTVVWELGEACEL